MSLDFPRFSHAARPAVGLDVLGLPVFEVADVPAVLLPRDLVLDVLLCRATRYAACQPTVGLP